MIVDILSIVLSIVFFTLGFIHFYWAFGGEWGIKNAIPTKKENEHIHFRPSPFATIIVGVILSLFGVFYIFQNSFVNIKLPNWTKFLLWITPTLFLLRVIGDFKYVGIFKNIKNTLFAKWDNKLYIPLCFCIGVLGWLFYLSS